MKWFNVFIGFVIATSMAFAPSLMFDATTTNIDYSESNGTFSVSSKIFTEQLESTLGMKATESGFDAAADKYFKSNFTIYVNGVKQNMVFSGRKDSPKVLWLYYEVDAKGVKSIKVTNRLFFASFPEQQNIIKIDYLGRIFSSILKKSADTASFDL
ncbi:MAG: hypothetical protein C4K58_01710 [Flavobacteriaceae bacterium]|nr:MAG: hypothetical protein C4K58_01710 [Flavobacteriaceae bacterium]